MPEERDLIASVVQLANLLTRRLAPVFESAKITPQQWAVLTTIAGSDEPMSLASVARQMSVTKQNMTGMARRLEQLGLAERVGDPNDMRSSRIQLTRRGRAIVDKAGPAYEKWQNSLREELTDREIQTLTRAVNRLIVRLEQPS